MFLRNSVYFGFEMSFVVAAVLHYIMRGFSKLSGFPVEGRFRIDGGRATFMMDLGGGKPLERDTDIDVETVQAIMSGDSHVKAWILSEKDLNGKHDWHLFLSVGPSEKKAMEAVEWEVLQAFLKAEGISSDSQFKLIADRFMEDFQIPGTSTSGWEYEKYLPKKRGRS